RPASNSYGRAARRPAAEPPLCLRRSSGRPVRPHDAGRSLVLHVPSRGGVRLLLLAAHLHGGPRESGGSVSVDRSVTLTAGRWDSSMRRKALVITVILAVLAVLAAAGPAAGGGVGAQAADPGPARVLVFTKTAGFRHASIGTAQRVLPELAKEYGFEVTITEDASVFNDDTLAQYDVVAFVLTTGDVLGPAQEAAMERFIRG